MSQTAVAHLNQSSVVSVEDVVSLEFSNSVRTNDLPICTSW